MMKKIIPTTLLVFFLFLQVRGQIERVEPPFWWTGMENNELQVMVYGEEIGLLTPEIGYDGVRISRTVLTGNPNYLFLYLDIGTGTLPGTMEIRFLDDQGETGVLVSYELLERESGADEVTGFNNSDVIYLITPDRFANGDPGNDNVQGMPDKLNREDKWGRHGGDIRGIQDHLDYLAGLGFTGIWLNPVLENNQPSSSYHGYSTTDFYRVDSRFGTNEEYRELSIEAGEKGIKMIMDMIVNHIGSGHWWMEDLPAHDWIHHVEDPFFTSHRRTTIRDPYASEYDLEQFEEGWFVRTMPDLNQDHPLLADYLVQNTIWWIEYTGLSGIRMDTYSYAGNEFMKQWTCAVMREYPGFHIVGEEWSLNPAILAYWQRGKVNPDGYTSCLPGLLDFPLQHALVSALTEEESWNSGMVNLYEMLSNDFIYADPFRHVIFPDNHDMSRIFTELNEDFDLWKLAMVYFATMRGTPQIYYGTEILMSNLGDNSHGNIRSDFPGGWEGDPVNGFTGKGLSGRQKEAQDFMRTLLNWRKDAEVIHSGKLMHFVPENGVYVYFRYDEEDRLMVVLNKSESRREISLEQFGEMLFPGDTGRDVLTGKAFTLEKNLDIDGKSALVLELNIP